MIFFAHATTIAGLQRRIRLSCAESGRGPRPHFREGTGLRGVRGSVGGGKETPAHAGAGLVRDVQPLALGALAAWGRRSVGVHAMADGYAHATLARGASHRGHRPSVPRAFQVVSDPRGRSSTGGAAVCGAKSSASESGGTGRRVAMVEPLASRSRHGGEYSGRGAGAFAARIGDDTSSRWKRRRSWRRYGVRWCVALRLERMRGKSTPQSVWACIPRCVRAAAPGNIPHPKPGI